jgi:hypothetical protein
MEKFTNNITSSLISLYEQIILTLLAYIINILLFFNLFIFIAIILINYLHYQNNNTDI